MTCYLLTTLLLFSLGYFAAASAANPPNPPALDSSEGVLHGDRFPLSSTIRTHQDVNTSSILSSNASHTSPQSPLDLDDTSVRKKRGKKNRKKRSKKKRQQKARSRASRKENRNKKQVRRPQKKSNKQRNPKSKKGSKRCKLRKVSCKPDCKKRNKRVGCSAAAPAIKMCTKNVRERYPCPGQKLPMCKVVEKEPAVCKRTVTKTMPCSRKASPPKEVCRTKSIQALCKTKECAKYEGVKCVYDTAKGPCEPKRGRCNECIGKYRLRHCTKTHTRRLEVSCPPNLSKDAINASPGGNSELQKQSSDPSEQDIPGERDSMDSSGNAVIAPRSENPIAPFSSPNSPVSPTPTPTPRPFEDANMFASNVRCLASLFDEEECYHSDMSCQLFSETFDSTSCAIQVCHDCKQVRYMPVSPGLKRYCFELLESSCRTLYSFDQTVRTRVPGTDVSARISSVTLPPEVTYDPNDGKCYKVERKNVSAPCNVLLSQNEHCVNGCIVGTCERTMRRTHFCKDNLPQRCKTPKRCQKEQKECTSVKEETAVCKFEIPVEYECEKKKTMSKPCIMGATAAFGKVGPQGGFAGQVSKNVQDRLNMHVKMCSRTVKKKYVCGKNNVLKPAKCVQKGCRARKCEVRTC